MTNQEFIESIRLEGEEWRDVVGREGSYIVSNLSRIATIRTHFEYERNGKIFQKRMRRHICSTSTAPSTPYERITFIEGGKKSTELVHVVVARAFVANPHGYPCVDHIDDDPTNNKAINLQWCTPKMNNSKEHHREATRKAKRGKPAQNRVKVVQLDGYSVVRILSSMSEMESNGFNHSAIHKVCNNKLSQYKGYRWMYLSDYETLVSMSKNSSKPGND